MNMRKWSFILLSMVVVSMVPTLQSCDDDGYSLGDFVIRMATVRAIGGNTYYLEIDNGKKLWPAATNIPMYRPTDGQRVIADFTLLADNFQGYDHAIKVNYLYDVRTKMVETLEAGSEDTFGDDPVLITDIWVGSKYLNVEFNINLPVNKRHSVHLIRNDNITDPGDGYTYLEYRYNTNSDVSGYWASTMVSFNLGEYGPGSVYKGIKVRINSAKNGVRELTFDFPADNPDPKEIENTDEYVGEKIE